MTVAELTPAATGTLITTGIDVGSSAVKVEVARCADEAVGA